MVYVILDATNYPIDCFDTKEAADKECVRRNEYSHNRCRVIRLIVRKR